MSGVPPATSIDLVRAQRVALMVGSVALAVCIIGAFVDPVQFFRAYLAVYLFLVGLPLGCLVILMICQLTGGAWGLLIRRILEAGIRTLPLLALGFIPIACGVDKLYVWAQPDAVAASRDLQYKQFYLNPTYFWLRAAAYFVVWLTLAYLLDRWSRQHERTGSARLLLKLERLGGIGLVLYGITIHFAAIDWLMSLQPEFHSSIFGPLLASSQLLSALALAALVVGLLGEQTPLAEVVSEPALNDVGNLLFTFLIIWAYMVFFQFMLVWIANLPVDVVWYVPRIRGGRYWAAWGLFVFHFAVPFSLLLLRGVKRNATTLAFVAGLILSMQLVYRFHQVLPAFPDTALREHWMDFVLPVALGGLWIAYFSRQLGRLPIVPQRDRNIAEAEHLRRLDVAEHARAEALIHG